MSSKYDKVSSIEEAYMQSMIFLARTFPHLYFLSKYLRVIYDEQDMSYIAKTNGKAIYLTMNWLTLPYHLRLAIFMHELYHVVLKHPLRMKQMNVYPLIANIACDAKVNYILLQSLKKRMTNIAIYEGFLSTFGVPEELLETASVEEIAKWLMKNTGTSSTSMKPTAGVDIEEAPDTNGDSGNSGNDKNDATSSSDGADDSQSQLTNRANESDTSDKESGQKVLNEGKSELLNSKNLNELEKELNKVIRDSFISAKIAGAKLSAIEERIVDSLTKSKVSWRSLLRNYINSYIKQNIVTSFKRPNRRIGYLPGQTTFSNPDAWVFVDVSGSIENEEFKQFLTEVRALSSFVNEIHLVAWDIGATNEYSLRGKDKERVTKLKFRGGGGTKFVPVLSKYTRRIKPDDVVICLTDGYWSDLKDAEKLIRKLRSTKILVTTNKVVKGFDKVVKIEGFDF